MSMKIYFLQQQPKKKKKQKKASCWTPSLLLLHEIFRIAQLMYSLISYIILLSSDYVVLDPL